MSRESASCMAYIAEFTWRFGHTSYSLHIAILTIAFLFFVGNKTVEIVFDGNLKQVQQCLCSRTWYSVAFGLCVGKMSSLLNSKENCKSVYWGQWKKRNSNNKDVNTHECITMYLLLTVLISYEMRIVQTAIFRQNRSITHTQQFLLLLCDVLICEFSFFSGTRHGSSIFWSKTSTHTVPTSTALLL